MLAAVVERIPRHTIRSGDCLLWTGATAGGRGNGSGRPCIKIAGCNLYVARVVLAVKLGRPLKKNMLAAHSCDQPLCVEGDHLDEENYTTNLRAAWARKRRRCRPSTLTEEA